MSRDRHVPVLVVGGGPVGLAMGVALGRLGVRSLVVERSSTTTDHPKSRGCWVRTMEIFRQWGVGDAIRARGLPDESDVFACFDPVALTEYGRSTPEPRGDQSPTWKSIVAQDAVEEELLVKLTADGVGSARFSTEFVGLRDLGTHVAADLRDLGTGETETWTADWLVAADGAGSPTRRAVGIEMIGPAVLAVMANEYIRIDLSDFPLAREAAGILCIPSKPGRPTFTFLNTDGRDRWLMVGRIGGDRDERDHPYTDAEVAEMAQWYLGKPGRAVTRINSSIWRMSMQTAESFRRGRVLLVGDAAHRFPPTGGFGLNTGVQDAHNLAWKLAFVLNGHAAHSLIDTYNAERRPVAVSNAEFSYHNMLRMGQLQLAASSGEPGRFEFWNDDLDNHLHSVGQSLGFRYEEGAVVPDGSTAAPSSPRFYTPSDRPGGRYPHAWLEPGVSTLDWFDDTFVLIVGERADDWTAAAGTVTERTGVPLVVRPAPPQAAAIGCKTGSLGAALVRPDGHVAWRMAWSTREPAATLEAAVRSVTGLSA